MNEGADSTRDLGRTGTPILYESSGITKSVISSLWDIVPLYPVCRSELFWLLWLQMIKPWSFLLCRYTMPDAAVLTCATVIQQSINKVAYPVSQSKLVGEPRSEPRIPEAKLSVLWADLLRLIFICPYKTRMMLSFEPTSAHLHCIF